MSASQYPTSTLVHRRHRRVAAAVSEMDSQTDSGHSRRLAKAKSEKSSLKAKSATARRNRAGAAPDSSVKSVLVVDVGGSSVKILATGQKEPRKLQSGPTLTPGQMVSGVKRLAADWKYDVVSIGYPGPVLAGRPVAEPRNLGRGWVGFNFARAFGRPVKLVNDAAMQALGSYKGGKMLFLGLGTGLGTAMIVEGVVAPMEVSHLPYKKGTYEHYVGRCGSGTQWQEEVAASRRRCRGAPHRGAAARRYCDRGRQYQEAQSPAAALSPGRQCPRVQRRLSVVGERQSCASRAAIHR